MGFLAKKFTTPPWGNLNNCPLKIQVKLGKQGANKKEEGNWSRIRLVGGVTRFIT
jgi:hypothetical protein